MGPRGPRLVAPGRPFTSPDSPGHQYDRPVTELLSTDLSDGVAVITLQRPEKRNALSIDLRVKLAAALWAASEDDGAGCVVLTGAGTTFCAGMDLTQFDGDAEHKRRLVETSTGVFEAVASCRRPLIAAVNGPALAGGFALAMLCDMRIASPSATFGFPELPIGIPPSYASVRNALGPAAAAEVSLTGRVFDAGEALRLGVVNEVAAAGGALERSLEVARGIAESPRAATLETKRRILADRRATLGDLLENEAQVFRQALGVRA